MNADLDAELARVALREPEVAAWVARHDDAAIRHAVAASLAASPRGALAGFTVGVKDVIDTADLPTEGGSAIFAGRRPPFDAACVAAARAAGGVITGKTVTAELAVLTPGPTRNPHRLSHTPGGSSSGSAAAVADGMVRVALGTQTAGSVIRPAAFCGVVGFKPTYQRVPMAGVHPFAGSLDTVGWFARSVDDAAAVLDALVGDERAPLTAPPRIGLYRSHEWPAAGPDTVAVVEQAAARLRGAGIEVVELDPLAELASAGRAAVTVMRWEGARTLAPERRAQGDLLSPALRELLERGDAMGPGRYAEAQRVAHRARDAFDRLLDGDRFDALLTAATPGEAPEGLASTGDPVFCRVWTLIGAPAVTVPAGRGSTGLPVGVQLVGARWADGRLCEVARVVAELLSR